MALIFYILTACRSLNVNTPLPVANLTQCEKECEWYNIPNKDLYQREGETEGESSLSIAINKHFIQHFPAVLHVDVVLTHANSCLSAYNILAVTTYPAFLYNGVWWLQEAAVAVHLAF